MPRPSTLAFSIRTRTECANCPLNSTYDITELEDCAIAVDASYYLSLLLDTQPSHEPLLTALGGLTGIQINIRQNLDLWDKHRIIPFFIFDGQSIVGQDEIALKRGRAANQKTDQAWELYSQTEAEQAVTAFGANPGAYQLQNLYPVLQGILKERGLHFLVPPFNACAQTVANACASFNDILQAHDPNWLDKYRKARMAAQHFIYIAENGEIKVNDFERLTKDSHEYLGLRMPSELLHYLNTGLIGPRILNAIAHGQIIILPTLDGTVSEEYKQLVTNQILPIKEQALSLVIPRVHRAIAHKDFVKKTFAKEKGIKGIDSTNMVASVVIWRFLHLRGYVDDSHKLTKWGNALATTLIAIRDTMEDRVPFVEESALLAFELLRFGLLSGKYREGAPGMPRKGTNEDKSCIILISQCASLLKLRHQAFGYTGALNKSLLGFRALSTTVREADRDLVEAIVASMFLYGQCNRDRADQLEISQKLPFWQEPDIGLGIAALTFFDDEEAGDDKEARAARLEAFQQTFIPLAEAFPEDLRIAIDFVSALNQGVQTLNDPSLPANEKSAWTTAQDYINARPF
ncbi:temperature dependent protein affecting M2 dsRNA replication domain-containing protein [Trichoderma sp. SZMC 28013]